VTAIRESLYIADEVSLPNGEITPIRSVDRYSGIGQDRRDDQSLQAEFYGIVRGRESDRYNWLTRLRGSEVR